MLAAANEDREIKYLRAFLGYLRLKKAKQIYLAMLSTNHAFLDALGADRQAKQLDDFEARVEKTVSSEFPEVRIIPSMKQEVPGAWDDPVHGGPAQDDYVKTQIFGNSLCGSGS